MNNSKPILKFKLYLDPEITYEETIVKCKKCDELGWEEVGDAGLPFFVKCAECINGWIQGEIIKHRHIVPQEVLDKVSKIVENYNKEIDQ